MASQLLRDEEGSSFSDVCRAMRGRSRLSSSVGIPSLDSLSPSERSVEDLIDQSKFVSRAIVKDIWLTIFARRTP